MLDVSDYPIWPEWANDESKDMLLKAYIDNKEGGLRDQFKRMSIAAARHAPQDGVDWAQKFFDMQWNGYYSNSSPCLTSLGERSKGTPVSCSSSFMADDLGDIFKTKTEIALLTKGGHGTAVHLDEIRPRGSLIGGRYKASGVMPIIKGLAEDMSYVNQGTRRGSIASHLSVEHGDFKEVCKYLKANHKKLNIGWNMFNSYIDKLNIKEESAVEAIEDIMEIRWGVGKGYMTFPDKCNLHLPEAYKRAGLKFRGSNLCQEVLLPTDSEHTLSCILGSLNISKYDEWKDTDLVKTAIVYLDCVCSEYLDIIKDKEGFEKIYNFTRKFRALGLGQLGLHTYMQDKSLVFGSYDSRMLNIKIAKQINEQSKQASEYLAEQLGEPEGCIGLGYRNASRLAIAPTKSSSNIMGGISQGIECYFSAAFVEDLSTGKVIRENPAFVRLLKKKGAYSKELMRDLAVRYNGSVQHLTDILTDHERQVFKAVFEINQIDVLQLCEARQKHLDQMQSINLTFGPAATPEEVMSVHKYAIQSDWVFSLYYMRRVIKDEMETFSIPDINHCLACE